MFALFFSEEPVRDWESASTCNTDRHAAYFRSMLEAGVYLAPSQFEAVFLSAAHTDADIGATLDAARKAFISLV
jgi:glutamate-1-semialdehyde 2,1-aminomutase